VSAPASAGTSGGGFADRSGRQIAAAARSDMAALRSLRVTGTVTTGGSEVSIDLRVDGDGNCTGSLGTQQGEVRLLGAAGRTYLKPDAAFWRGLTGARADRVMQVVGDRWVVVPSSEPTFRQFCNADELIDELVDELVSESRGTTYRRAGTATVDGRDVVGVDTSGVGGESSTGYVSVDAPHYLVRVEERGGTEPGTVTFSDFDVPVRTTAPVASDTIDLSRLGG
jgi:hypothetical protein